jgi:hypothetical protein
MGKEFIRAAFTAIIALLTPSVLLAETLTVPPCGFNPAITEATYSGIVRITVSGVVTRVPPNSGHDGFYDVNTFTNEAVVPTGAFRFARASASQCTCTLECAGTNFAVPDFIVGSYPEYNPEHIYTVLVDLGNTPDRIAFGISDCGCWDNSGQLTVTIEEDADNDGVVDSSEHPICLNTPSGATVNPVGCSLGQICPCSQPWGRVEWLSHGEYVSCVIRATKEFQDLGLMSRKQASETVRSARQSDCGR